MKWSWFGRAAMALVSALALGLSMSACGGGTIAYIWTIGQQYNQISGFKVDDYTGNLTQMPGSPYATNGVNPVRIVVKPGGRYVYVINQGSASTSTGNSNDANIAVFSVGGDGSLTFQQTYQSQGFYHLWADFDGTGTYLFVLDKYSPSGDGNGAITVFAADANTGRLTLVTQTASTPSGGVAPTYLEVGSSPRMMADTSSCLFTINQADQSITPFSYANGQLSYVTTGKIFPGTSNVNSINGNSTYMVLTDPGIPSSNGTYSTSGQIFPFTVSSACGLTPLTGQTSVANQAGVSDPVYSLLDAKSQYLYILNATTTGTSATSVYSQITGYTISNGQLSPLSESPFKSGPGPVCMVEDPTAKYMYESNFNDGTITGYTYSSTEGTLSDLPRGSTFQTNDAKGQCLALSGSVE